MTRRAAIVLAVAFLLVNGVRLVQLGGPRRGVDTGRYLSGVTHLLAGSPYQANEGSYRGYVWLLAFASRVFGRPDGVIVFQWLLGIGSTWLLYQLLLERTNLKCAAVGAAVYVVYPDISQWNNYALSDSVYISSIVALLFSFHRVLRAPSAARWCGAACALAATALIRPSGWIVVAVTAALLCWELPGANRRSLVLAVVALAAAAFVYTRQTALAETLYRYHPLESLLQGTVIDDYRPAARAMPPPTFTPDGSLTSYRRYVLESPRATAGLLGARLFYAFLVVRPYYSALHNLLLAVMAWPVNLLAFVALPSVAKDRFARYAGLVCLAHMAAIALLFMDWDGRYYVHMLPPLIVLAMDSLWAGAYFGVTRNRPPGLASSTIHTAPSGPTSTSRMR